MYKHILIATDGSELAGLGLDHGLRLAASLGAAVTVVTVTEPLQERIVQAAALAGVHDAAERYQASVEEDLAERFAAIRSKAAAAGIEPRLISAIDHSPAEAIVRNAEENGCDLIVMSSHGRRGVRRLILGSQASEVLASSKVPVLVIRGE